MRHSLTGSKTTSAFGQRVAARVPPAATASSALVVLACGTLLAHTPVTTKYRFVADVQPVLERHCTRCHRDGRSTPMALTTYADVRPWAVSIKERVLARSMPPSPLRLGGEPLVEHSALSARELDVLVDWASGGAPGPKRGQGAQVELATDSGGFDGDLTEQSFVLGRLQLAADQTAAQLQRRVKLLKSTHVRGWTLRLRGATVLRSATLRVSTDTAARRWMGSLVVGDRPWVYPQGAGWTAAAGTTLDVDLRVAKTWKLRRQAVSAEVELVVATSSEPPIDRVVARQLVGTGGVWHAAEDARLIAISTSGQGLVKGDLGGDSAAHIVELHAVRPEWPITYRLAQPFALGRGPLTWSFHAASGTPLETHLLYVVRAAAGGR